MEIPFGLNLSSLNYSLTHNFFIIIISVGPVYPLSIPTSPTTTKSYNYNWDCEYVVTSSLLVLAELWLSWFYD